MRIQVSIGKSSNFSERIMWSHSHEIIIRFNQDAYAPIMKSLRENRRAEPEMVINEGHIIYEVTLRKLSESKRNRLIVDIFSASAKFEANNDIQISVTEKVLDL